MAEHNKAPQRITSVDRGRGLAILMIVSAHVLRKGTLADYLMSTGVALFCILSGYLIPGEKKRSFPQKAARRLRRIYVPYLLVGLVSILVYAGLGHVAASFLSTKSGEMETGVLTNIGYLLFANSKNHHSMKWNETLWFLPCFLLALLFSAEIEYAVAKIRTSGAADDRKKGQNRLLAGILLRLVLSALFLLLGAVLVHRFDARLPFQGESACHLLPMLELGVTLGELFPPKKEEAGKKSRAALAAIVLIVVGILLSIPFGRVSIRTDEYPAGLLSYLTVLVSAVGYFAFVKALPDIRFLEVFGERSLGIMLWNKFPVVAVQAAASHVGIAGAFLEKSTFLSGIAALLLGCVCILLCLFWTGIPKWVGRITKQTGPAD
ncbi:MAG: acyltransferase [Lachnospiraceae bacterium]